MNFFSCRKVSNILPVQNSDNTFLLIFFISDLIRDEKYVNYYLHIFHLLCNLMHLSVTSTPFSMCFALDVETTHSNESCLFLHFLIWLTGQSNFSGCFSWAFLKMEDLQLSTLHILVFFFFKIKNSVNMSISASKKEHLFSRVKGYFLIIDIAHTKTLVFSFLLDEIGWFKNNRQIYAIYNLVSLW